MACSCAKITDEEWEGVELDWENKSFYFIPMRNILNKPIDLEEKSRSLKREIAAKGYEFVDPRVILCEWASFKGRLLTRIKEPLDYDANIHKFDTGKIYTTVFRGKTKNLKQAVKDFHSQVELNHGIPVQSSYVWYAHCSKCAKTRDNVSVIFMKA